MSVDRRPMSAAGAVLNVALPTAAEPTISASDAQQWIDSFSTAEIFFLMRLVQPLCPSGCAEVLRITRRPTALQLKRMCPVQWRPDH